MRKIIITDEDDYPIQPEHINATGHLWDAFGKNETEISAGYIVRLCQQNGSWRPFTENELEEFYSKSGHKGFHFNGLDSRGLIVLTDYKYYVTHEFITNCFKASPQPVPAKVTT